MGEINATQTVMTAWASYFSESEHDHLRCVVRLTVEFFYFLRRSDIESVDSRGLEYVGHSIFCGVESFFFVCHAYRIAVGATRSSLPERVISRAALKEKYIAMYNVFAAETNMEKKVRLLLDLYKLQIVFAGLTYDH
jgi:hypothetical protein